MGTKNNIYISLDSDSATIEALSDKWSYDVGWNLPAPKLAFADIPFMNGSLDVTNAIADNVYFNNRTINISLALKNGAVGYATACADFINKYDGEVVRVYNYSDNTFMRGRLTVLGDNMADEMRMLSVQVNAEPLRYGKDYLPANAGADISPEALGSSIWNQANVTANDSPYTAVTPSGGEILANASQVEGEGNVFTVVGLVGVGKKLVRFYFENLVNCKIELRKNGKVIGEGANKSHISLTENDLITVHAFRTNTSAAASFSCGIREIATWEVYNFGKAVSFQIEHDFSSGGERKPIIFVNGVLQNLGAPIGAGVWNESPIYILQHGANTIAAFVDSPSFDPSQASGTIKYRYRRGDL